MTQLELIIILIALSLTAIIVIGLLLFIKTKIEKEELNDNMKKYCHKYAMNYYAEHKSFVGALAECYDHPDFNDLTEDEICDIVDDAIEEVKEKQSDIYNQ